MVLIFGAVGWLMVRFDWQRPPLLLGLVLGGIAENNLFIATKVYGAGFVLRPGVLLIFVADSGRTVLPRCIRPGGRRSGLERHEARFEVPGVTKTDGGGFAKRARGQRRLRAVLRRAVRLRAAGGASGASAPTRNAPPCSRSIIGLPAFAISIAVFVKEIATTSKVVVHGEEGVEEVEEISAGGNAPSTNPRHRRLGGGFLHLHLADRVRAIRPLVATFLYLKFGAREGWLITVILTATAYVFFAGIFDWLLHLPFPPGDLFVWLGLD